MAKSINKVELLGRVGADPEMKLHGIRHRRNPAPPGHRPGAQGRRGRGRLAHHRGLGQAGRAVANYVEKGQRLYVSGRLAQNSWTGDDGQRRYRTEIHAQDVVFLDSSRNGSNGSGNHANTGVGSGASSGDNYPPADEDSPF